MNEIDVLRFEHHPGPGSQTQELGFFDQKPRLLVSCMIALFLLAGAFRLYRIDAPGLLVDRDYTSAILARDFYFQRTASVEEWRKQIAHPTRMQPYLPPPIVCLFP